MYIYIFAIRMWLGWLVMVKNLPAGLYRDFDSLLMD